MDWNRAIERNRRALWQVLAMLIAMAGLVGDHRPFAPDGRRWPKPAAGVPDPHEVWNRPTLPRRLHRAVLRLLRAAEASARRLVVIAARGIVVPAGSRACRTERPASVFVRSPCATGIFLPSGVALPGAGAARPEPALSLFDPTRRLSPGPRSTPGAVPRISLPGLTVPFALGDRHPPLSDDRLDASRLVLRLQALGAALDDIEGRALRLARWRARRAAELERERSAGPDASVVPQRPRRVWPLRAGRPPGSCRRSGHEVHFLLRDLHGLALDALRDTS